jgi:sugar lactone lactonase YvrE
VGHGTTKNSFLNDIFPTDDKGWELVIEGHKFTEGVIANAAGEVFFQDILNAKTYKVGLDGKTALLPIDSKCASGTSFSTDGQMITITSGWGCTTRQVIGYDKQLKATVLADSLGGNDILIANNGNIYITQPDGREKPSKIYLLRPNGERVVVDEGIKFANGLCLSPDQTQMYITESTSHWVWVYQIKSDGTLSNKQRFGWLHVLDNNENAWSDGLKCDKQGRVYVTSQSGIQVLDQLGKVNAIIPVPSIGQCSNLCFGGANFDILYVTSVDKVYRRKVKVQGVQTFEKPMKPVTPRM